MRVVNRCLFLMVLLYPVFSEFTFYQDKSVTSTFIKSYENAAPKLCKQFCADLSICNSIVFTRSTLMCFLFEGDCDTNVIVNQEGSTYGCFSNKTDKCGTLDSTYIPLTESAHLCVSTECTSTYPNVRNSHVTNRQFDPPRVTLQCNSGYTYNGTSSDAVCVPGQGWITFNSRCYLEGVEEANPIDYGDQFGKPLISNWTTIESQTAAHCSKHIPHNCGTLPVKVEVQIRSKSGDAYSNFIFNGVSSGQTDDDDGNVYGGVLYKYDDKEVVLYAPRRNYNNYNNNTQGFSIYTGGTTWNGPFSRKEYTADVRVKTWCPSQIKMPAFESIWYPIKESDNSQFYEIYHPLWEDPRLVIVQVRLGETNQFVDAIGSSSVIDAPYRNYGGLIYGTSSFSIRMWRAISEPLFSNNDGWGPSLPDFNDGYVKFRLWTEQDLSSAYKEVPIGVNNIVISASLPQVVDMDKDLIFISTKVSDGNNAGFSFPADCSVQESKVGSSFGSVVYAFSQTDLAVWKPLHDGTEGGKLVYIGYPWGGGVNEQRAEYGTLQITIVKGETDGDS